MYGGEPDIVDDNAQARVPSGGARIFCGKSRILASGTRIFVGKSDGADSDGVSPAPHVLPAPESSATSYNSDTVIWMTLMSEVAAVKAPVAAGRDIALSYHLTCFVTLTV
jgi:hypothetical protein